MPTSYIKHLAKSTNFKISTFKKHCKGLNIQQYFCSFVICFANIFYSVFRERINNDFGLIFMTLRAYIKK